MKRHSSELPDRLIKLLGLFGSDHAGERATAARMAHHLIVRNGLTWADVIRTPPPPMPRMNSLRESGHGFGMKAARVMADHQRRARVMLISRCGFSDFERSVLETLTERRSMSAKQESIFRECAGKYERYVAAREVAP